MLHSHLIGVRVRVKLRVRVRVNSSTCDALRLAPAMQQGTVLPAMQQGTVLPAMQLGSAPEPLNIRPQVPPERRSNPRICLALAHLPESSM